MKRTAKILIILFIITFILILIVVGIWYYVVSKELVSEEDFIAGKTAAPIFGSSNSKTNTTEPPAADDFMEALIKMSEKQAERDRLDKAKYPKPHNSKDHKLQNGYYDIRNEYGCPDDPLCQQPLTYIKDPLYGNYLVGIKPQRTHWRIIAIDDILDDKGKVIKKGEPDTYIMYEQSTCPTGDMCLAQLGISGLRQPETPSGSQYLALEKKLQELQMNKKVYQSENNTNLLEQVKKDIVEVQEEIDDTIYNYSAGIGIVEDATVRKANEGGTHLKFSFEKVKILPNGDGTYKIELADMPGYYLSPSRLTHDEMKNQAWGKFSKTLPNKWKLTMFVPKS